MDGQGEKGAKEVWAESEKAVCSVCQQGQIKLGSQP